MTISLKSNHIIKVPGTETNAIMTDMITEDLGKDKEIDSTGNIEIIGTIVVTETDIEIVETIETDRGRDKEIEIDTTKTIKAEIHRCLLHLIQVTCPTIVFDFILRLGLYDSSTLYECLWTPWRALSNWSFKYKYFFEWKCCWNFVFFFDSSEYECKFLSSGSTTIWNGSL